MRHVRVTLGLAVGACVFALAAAPALAHEFTASKAGNIVGKVFEPPVVKSGSEEYVIGAHTQSIKLGPFKIYCDKALAKGAVGAGTSPTFATTLKFSKCWVPFTIGGKQGRLAAHFTAPLSIEYHANGFVETASGLEETAGWAKLAKGEAEIKVNTGLTAGLTKSVCLVHWPEQTLPVKAESKPELEYSEVSYSDEATPQTNLRKFPDGFQHSVVVHNVIKGIKYEFEEAKCEEWGKEQGSEGGGGTYTGSFAQVLTGGNFEFS